MDGDQPVLLRAKRREEGGRGEDRLIDQPAHPGDAADLVHSRTDHGEIQAFAAAEIPVHDFPQVEAEIEVGCRQPARVAPLLEFLNLPKCLMRCCKRCTASRGSIFAGKHCQAAIYLAIVLLVVASGFAYAGRRLRVPLKVMRPEGAAAGFMIAIWLLAIYTAGITAFVYGLQCLSETQRRVP